MRQNNPSLYFSSDFPDSLLCIFFDNKVLRFVAGELFVFVLYCVRYSVDFYIRIFISWLQKCCKLKSIFWWANCKSWKIHKNSADYFCTFSRIGSFDICILTVTNSTIKYGRTTAVRRLESASFLMLEQNTNLLWW